MEVLQKADPVN